MAGRRKRKQNVKGDVRYYTLYVNPKASIASDPERLQKQALPILERWFYDDTIKDNVLRAVLHYTQSYPEAGLPVEQQWAYDQAQYLAHHLIPMLKKIIPAPQVIYTNGTDNTPDIPPLDAEEEDFISDYLQFEED